MPSHDTEQRKLAAIMFTDMVGYSALTQRNETLALALLHEQQRLLRPIFAQHSGREVKGTGDGFLVDFASALQAVSCAIDMQKALVEYNASAPAERRIQVRIGLHLGDVVVRDGDVFGDGVNIAARIVFAIRSQVAQTVAKALQVTLAADERQRLEQKPTENLEAYQLYLKGRYYVNRYTEDGLKKGLGYLQQAIALDPGYALAYQGLASYYFVVNDWFAAPKDAMPRMRAAAEKALQIDPTLSEPHTFLAGAAWSYDWNWSAAEKEYKRALALDANSVVAHQFYGLYLTAIRLAPEGIAEIRRAVELDPLSPEANSFLGAAFFYAHRYAEAIAQLRETLEIEPNYLFAHLFLGKAYVQNGELERGIAELRRAKELDLHNPEGTSALGYAYAVAGDRDAAQRVIEELRQQSQASYVSPYFFALTYAALGETDQAFTLLDRAYDDRSFFIALLKVEQMVDPLRADPRFTELLKKVGLDK